MDFLLQNQTLLNHAGCMAAGTRDGWRTALYYMRDLVRADNGTEPALLSRIVGKAARLVERSMTGAATVAVRLFLPNWRALPSPFSPGLLNDMAQGVRDTTIVRNPRFNAYFFRALIKIAERFYESPVLVLEHRVDATRRALSDKELQAGSITRTMAHVLIHLVDQRPVARVGAPHSTLPLFQNVDPNAAIAAISCVALLLAEDGDPGVPLNEDEFFGVTAALMGPQLAGLTKAIEDRDVEGLARRLEALRALY
jgi:hypothetical protein